MRLIDADALTEQMKGMNMLFSPKIVIDNMPTAYDIDKVVEELEDEREEILNNNDYENEIINYCLDSFDRAIEIVKQGVR